MKKRRIASSLIVILILIAVIPVSAGNGKNRILNSGFSFSCIIGFVPNNYAFAESVATPERELGLLIGGEIGNRFYTPLNDKIAFGAMINWIEIAVTQKKSTGNLDWLSDPILDIAFFETGPILTYAINTTTGLDVYYNARPSIIGDKAFAVSHNVGVGFRKYIFMLNLEYVFGNYPIGEYINSKPEGTEINHLRLSFGLKF